MKIYKNRYTSVVLISLVSLFFSLFGSQCFGVQYQYVKVNNNTKEVIKIDQLEEFTRHNGSYFGDTYKVDPGEFSRIEPGGKPEIWTARKWYGMDVKGKNFDHKAHNAVLHILGEKTNIKLTNKPSTEDWVVKGKKFKISVFQSNWRFYENSGRHGSIRYPDYTIVVAEE